MKNFKYFLFASVALSLVASSVQAQPAPALSYVQIRHVGSSTQGWENIPDNLFTTNLDHGGVQLRVATVEVGYGSLPIATINGSVLPNSANYSSVPFCNLSNYLAPCRSGQNVVGWVRYWRLDGNQSGRFSYRNTSTNFPRNTLSDSINIR